MTDRKQGEFDFQRGSQLRLLTTVPLPEPRRDERTGKRVSSVRAMRHVLRAIDDHARDKPTATLKHDTIAEWCDCSRRTVLRALRALEAERLLEITPNTAGGKHAATYRIAWANLRDLAAVSTAIDVADHAERPAAGDVTPRHVDPGPMCHRVPTDVTPRPDRCDTVSHPKKRHPNRELNRHGSSTSVGDVADPRPSTLDPRLPWLRHVTPDDLTRPHLLDRLHRRAVEAGAIADDDAQRVRFFAACVYARRARNPGGMLRTIVARGAWGYATDADTDTARRLDRELRSLAEGTSALPGSEELASALAIVEGRPCG